MNQNTQSENKANKAHNKTKSYKHISIERKRPELSKSSQVSCSKIQSLKPNLDIKLVKKNVHSVCKVIPLGGLDGIGKNMCAFECDGDILIDDAGLMFPDDDHPGIDLILPDYTYLLENADKIKAIFITHGHEDHTGCLPYLLKDLEQDVLIYGSKMTLGLIEIKLNEFHIANAKLIEVNPGSQIKCGCFLVNFFSVNHSIPDALGVFIQSPAGNIMHTGDFKLDQSPIDGLRTDFESIHAFSKIGIDLLMSDSTNATRQGFTPSESVVGASLSSLISQAKGKVIIASFASHIHRLQQICDAAVANGRKVVVTGRSMIQNTDIARKLGYLHISDEDIIDSYYFDRIPSNEIVVMCTGSQGEPLSALARIASGGHKSITIEKDDTVIISATPVPGNEKSVSRVINLLSKIGADVYDRDRALVHVSGHASSEELKLLLSIAKPKNFMPVHGEAMHLQAHAKLARQMGIQQDHIYILDNGDSLKMQNGIVALGPTFPNGVVYVDGLSVGDTSRDVLDTRITLGTQGIAIISLAINTNNHQVAGNVIVRLQGITGFDDEYLLDEATRVVAGSARKALSKNTRLSDIHKILKDSLLSLLWERIKQRPVVSVNIIEV